MGRIFLHFQQNCRSMPLPYQMIENFDLLGTRVKVENVEAPGIGVGFVSVHSLCLRGEGTMLAT